MKLEKLDQKFRAQINTYITEEWGDPIISRGNIIHTETLPGFIVADGDKLAGFILYQIIGGACEIVVLNSYIENSGGGTSLINSVIAEAKSATCSRVWLITTNDNIHAIRYYQRRGFSLKAVHINAFDVTRALKYNPLPEGLLGNDDIPIKHEFEFEILLKNA